MKIAVQNGKYGWLTVSEKNVFRLDFSEFMEGFFWRGNGRSKGAGTDSGKSGTRNLEANGIRSRAENMGGNVKPTTVTELRLSSVHDTFTAESVHFVFIPENETSEASAHMVSTLITAVVVVVVIGF